MLQVGAGAPCLPCLHICRHLPSCSFTCAWRESMHMQMAYVSQRLACLHRHASLACMLAHALCSHRPCLAQFTVMIVIDSIHVPHCRPEPDSPFACRSHVRLQASCTGGEMCHAWHRASKSDCMPIRGANPALHERIIRAIILSYQLLSCTATWLRVYPELSSPTVTSPQP